MSNCNTSLSFPIEPTKQFIRTLPPGEDREPVPLPAKSQALVLALDQGELRSQLDVDHQADASIQLEKSCGFLSGENPPKDGDILLAKLS
jgi:hypothetical protein